ncbi:MAG: SpoIID/LytB domain-containing protein, partial [Patescibacteria group bacterium]
SAVASGSWVGNAAEKEILFNTKSGRYVKFVSLAEATGINTDCVAEIAAMRLNEDGSEIESEISQLGPDISVGLWNYTKDSIKETPFKIEANKKYNIKDSSGNIIANVDGGTITRVTYDSDKNFKAYNSIPEKLINREVFFDATDGDNSNIIFDIYRPTSEYDQYRGKIKVRYTDSNNIWVINILPMEQYAWGMGETTGTGPFEHTKVMTTIFRTYGYWYAEYATKYLPYGFRIRSDSGSQIYRGYDWEKKYTNIKKAADETRGSIVRYKGEIALTPYSSWTDGRTRSFEERWGSKDYPWCQSVKDPYGKHPTMTTAQLEAAGNHMVGLSANGSVKLAGENYKKSYDWILKYYYTGISIDKMY